MEIIAATGTLSPAYIQQPLTDMSILHDFSIVNLSGIR